MKKLVCWMMILSLCMMALITSAAAENVTGQADGESGWTCENGHGGNSGNFCVECGAPRPTPAPTPEPTETPAPVNADGVWTCENGHEGNTGMFCVQCGAPKPEEVHEEILANGETGSVTYEGPGFDTPEEAVICYMQGWKNLDFEQILRAFAWETQIEHFSVKALYMRTKTYSPVMKPRIPFVNEFMSDVSMHYMRAYVTDSLYQSLEAYLMGEDYQQGVMISLKDENEVDAFLQKYDVQRLEKLSEMSGIRLVSPDEVTDGKFSMEGNQQTFAKQTAMYGGDEAVNIVGLANVGDETFYCCPTVIRYGEKWYLVSPGSFTSAILGVDMNHQAFCCGTDLGKDINQ